MLLLPRQAPEAYNFSQHYMSRTSGFENASKNYEMQDE